MIDDQNTQIFIVFITDKSQKYNKYNVLIVRLLCWRRNVSLETFHYFTTYAAANSYCFFNIIDYWMRTTSSGKLEITLYEKMTALYQCMTFWYRFHNITGGSFKSIQVLGGNVLELSHTLEATSGRWVFSEMPLQRNYTNSKVRI